MNILVAIVFSLYNFTSFRNMQNTFSFFLCRVVDETVCFIDNGGGEGTQQPGIHCTMSVVRTPCTVPVIIQDLKLAVVFQGSFAFQIYLNDLGFQGQS